MHKARRAGRALLEGGSSGYEAHAIRTYLYTYLYYLPLLQWHDAGAVRLGFRALHMCTLPCSLRSPEREGEGERERERASMPTARVPCQKSGMSGWRMPKAGGAACGSRDAIWRQDTPSCCTYSILARPDAYGRERCMYVCTYFVRSLVGRHVKEKERLLARAHDDSSLSRFRFWEQWATKFPPDGWVASQVGAGEMPRRHLLCREGASTCCCCA